MAEGAELDDQSALGGAVKYQPCTLGACLWRRDHRVALIADALR